MSVSPAAPVPVAIVAVAPPAVVIVIDDAGRVAVGLDSRSEYHAPVDAMELITTVCVPATVPVAADAVRSLVFEEVTVRAARGPVSVFKFCISVAIAVVAAWMEVRAVVWLVNVV